MSILTPSFSCTFGYTFPLFLSRCQTTMVLLSGCASLSTEAKRIPVDMVTCSRSTASAFHRHSPRVVPQPLPAGSHINWHTVGRDLLEAQLQGYVFHERGPCSRPLPESMPFELHVPGLCQRACLSGCSPRQPVAALSDGPCGTGMSEELHSFKRSLGVTRAGLHSQECHYQFSS